MNINLPPGSWDKGETDSSGAGVANRQLTITSDTSFAVTIHGWQDDFPSLQDEKKSTASKHVVIMDTASNQVLEMSIPTNFLINCS